MWEANRKLQIVVEPISSIISTAMGTAKIAITKQCGHVMSCFMISSLSNEIAVSITIIKREVLYKQRERGSERKIDLINHKIKLSNLNDILELNNLLVGLTLLRKQDSQDLHKYFELVHKHK